KADGERGLLAGLREDPGAGVPGGGLVADPAAGLELAVADEAARVHHALGDALAVEVADLLEEVVIFQRGRSAAAHGALGLVVVDRVALAVGQDPRTVPVGLVVHRGAPRAVGKGIRGALPARATAARPRPGRPSRRPAPRRPCPVRRPRAGRRRGRAAGRRWRGGRTWRTASVPCARP